MMEANDFDWMTDTTYDGAKVLRGINDYLTIDIMPLVLGKFMVIIIVDGVAHFHGDERGVYVWDRREEAKQAAIAKVNMLLSTMSDD